LQGKQAMPEVETTVSEAAEPEHSGSAVKDPDDDESLRRCIASGDRKPPAELLRFVVGPDGTIVPDLACKLPGRGLWLSPRRDMIDKACIRNLFAKAAKSTVRVPEDLVSLVERLLNRRCLELISLAKRAGQLVAGHDKVKAWLAAGRAGLLIQAADAADDGRGKLRALGRAVTPGLPVLELFDAEQLGRTLGRPASVHIAVAPGGFADRIVAEAARLAGVRNGDTKTDSPAGTIPNGRRPGK
jgi:hypothetical protein